MLTIHSSKIRLVSDIMGLEGGLSTVQQIILVIIAAVLLIGLALIFTDKTQALGCGWADQAISGFYSMISKTPPVSVCG